MYAGRVACCRLVSHVEYAPRALFTLEKKTGQTDKQTDGCQTVLHGRVFNSQPIRIHVTQVNSALHIFGGR